MLFKFLDELNDCQNKTKLYSVAFIDSKINHKTYKIRYKDSSCFLSTKENLKPGDWIKFVGTFNKGVIETEYIEILIGVDINLIVKCIAQIKEHS